MPKKPKLSEEEIEAFQKAMADAKPLIKKKKIRLTRSFVHRHPPIKARHDDENMFDSTRSLDIADVSGEEFIAFKQDGISNKTLRKLRKGQYNVEATLDLHGMTVEASKTAVNEFLQQCLQERNRVVVIIHGKGHHSQMPILKNKLNHWLRETNMVLAFCSAAPTHGSRGAIYVLLKRRSLIE